MLPLIGTLQETGLTEDQLRESLRRRPGRYMHTPQLALYVCDYSSRQVAVIGAVSRPGLSSPAGFASKVDFARALFTFLPSKTVNFELIFDF